MAGLHCMFDVDHTSTHAELEASRKRDPKKDDSGKILDGPGMIRADRTPQNP